LIVSELILLLKKSL